VVAEESEVAEIAEEASVTAEVGAGGAEAGGEDAAPLAEVEPESVSQLTDAEQVPATVPVDQTTAEGDAEEHSPAA
jgi:hypothetical protein